jgi:hypothetical protein
MVTRTRNEAKPDNCHAAPLEAAEVSGTVGCVGLSVVGALVGWAVTAGKDGSPVVIVARGGDGLLESNTVGFIDPSSVGKFEAAALGWPEGTTDIDGTGTRVGWIEGIIDGSCDADGESDGSDEGEAVWMVGLSEGEVVGPLDGTLDGVPEGGADGASVGATEGVPEGATVGACDCVGEAVVVGEFVGSCVGDDVVQSKQKGPSQTCPEAHTGLSGKGQPVIWKAFVMSELERLRGTFILHKHKSCENEVAPSKMDSNFERDWKFHEEMSWLKDSASANMKEALVTDWTFQLSNGWLKEVQFENIRFMLVARLTSQSDISSLKLFLPSKSRVNDVTLETSQQPIGCP